MSVANDVNNSFELFEPYPNPANNGTVEISFNMIKAGYAKVTVNDAMGRIIATPFEGQVSTGFKGFNLNTTNFATGTYYINVSVGNYTSTKILNVIK